MGVLRNVLRNIAARSRFTDFATKILPPWATIFMVHRFANPELGIDGVEPEHLRQCLRYLRQNNYELISVDEAVERTCENRLGSRKWVAFTLDDGFADQIDIGGKIFREFDCPATFFLITGFVDGTLWPWDYQLMHLAKLPSRKTIHLEHNGIHYQIELGTDNTKALLLKLIRQIATDDAYLIVNKIFEAAEISIPTKPPLQMSPTTWADVRAAEKAGMSFGAHSVSHRIFSRLSDAALSREIGESYRRVREECSAPSQLFCFPSGKLDEFDARAITHVSALKLQGALSAEPGYLEVEKALKYDAYRFAIPRMSLPDDFDEFKLYVSWAQHLRERAITSPLQDFVTKLR